MVAVPINRLYDHGSVIARSGTLASRLEQPHVVMHPSDAAKFGDVVRMLGQKAAVLVDETMPAGFVRVPRSLGFALDEPTEIELMEKVTA
jgi:hypothetical protein